MEATENGRSADVAESPDVLIIDDQPEVRALVTHFLRRRGFSVWESETFDSAAVMIEHHPPAAIVLDLLMGDEDGADFLRRIRQSHAPGQLPVLVLTSSRRRADMLRCLEAGANDFLNKPADAEALAARLATHIGISSRFRELEQRSAVGAPKTGAT